MLITEWDGDYINALDMKDAKEWITFVVYKDKVEAVLDSSTKNYPEEFFKTLKKIAIDNKTA